MAFTCSVVESFTVSRNSPNSRRASDKKALSDFSSEGRIMRKDETRISRRRTSWRELRAVGKNYFLGQSSSPQSPAPCAVERARLSAALTWPTGRRSQSAVPARNRAGAAHSGPSLPIWPSPSWGRAGNTLLRMSGTSYCHNGQFSQLPGNSWFYSPNFRASNSSALTCISFNNLARSSLAEALLSGVERFKLMI